MTSRQLLWAVFGLAAALRLPRMWLRWEEWALHYASYNHPTQAALRAGDWGTAFTTFAGLHPPLYPLLQASMEILWPAPILWLGFSTLCSLAAVFFITRDSAGSAPLLAACVFATDPIQLHYAAEVNNYPLTVAVIALAWAGVRTQRAIPVIIAAGLSPWIHLLAAVGVALAAMGSRLRWRVWATILLAGLPLWAIYWQLGTDWGTARQPPMHVGASIADIYDRFGLWWLLLLPVLLMGARRRPWIGIAWAGTLGFWWAMVAVKIAAPHQFPYALALGPPAALLVAAGATHPWIRRAVLAACLLRGGSAAWDSTLGLGTLSQAQPRGIDQALAQSKPGDAVVLVRGMGRPDDDRRHISPSLWRIRPWTPLPALDGNGHHQTPAQGQPRNWNGRALYTFDNLSAALIVPVEQRKHIVLYDGAEEAPLPEGFSAKPVGPDLLLDP